MRPRYRIAIGLMAAPLLMMLSVTPTGAQDLLGRVVNRDAAGEVDALELLRASAETISTYDHFSGKLVASANVTQGATNQSDQEVIALKAAAPSKYSVEVLKPAIGVRVQSDGQQTMTYVGPLGRYAVNDQSNGLSDFAQSRLATMVCFDFGRLVFGSLDTESAELVIKEVTDSEYLGEETVGGQQLQHARYSAGQMTWDAWFTTGDKPRLARLKPDLSEAIARMQAMQGDPDFKFEMVFDLKDVDTESELADDAFSLEGPEGAEEVEFAKLFAPPPQPPHQLLGRKAPVFEANAPGGEPVDMGEVLGEKIVILDFWATWCGPCVAAMPKIDKVADEYADKDVVLYAVNQGEDAETVNNFLERLGIEVPVALDTEGEAAGMYSVEGLPTTVIVGKDGRVQVVHVGFSEALEDTLREELDALLEGADLAADEINEWNQEHPDDQVERGDG